MFRFMLLGLAAATAGLTAGWMVPDEKLQPLTGAAPIRIELANLVRTERLSAPVPAATSNPVPEVQEVVVEPSESRFLAKKRKSLKTRLAGAPSMEPRLQTGRCGEDDEDDDEC